jgi:hypothetical protein
MANRKKLIDEINSAFIEFIKNYRGKRYTKIFKEINQEIIDRRGLISQDEIRRLIERKVKDVNFEDIAVFSLLLGSITTIMENRRLARKQKEQLAPIIAAIAVYSIARPKKFVDKIHKSYRNPTSANEKKVNVLLKRTIVQNKETITRIQTLQKDSLVKTQTLAKTEQAKHVIDDMAELTAKGKPIEMQKHWLRRKYNSNKVIMRALDTEAHSSMEIGKLVQAKDDGFTKKTWKTQGDNKVRKTSWHSGVANMTVPIDEDFIVGSLRASAPADDRLPVGERVHCRCYLVYE